MKTRTIIVKKIQINNLIKRTVIIGAGKNFCKTIEYFNMPVAAKIELTKRIISSNPFFSELNAVCNSGFTREQVVDYFRNSNSPYWAEIAPSIVKIQINDLKTFPQEYVGLNNHYAVAFRDLRLSDGFICKILSHASNDKKIGQKKYEDTFGNKHVETTTELSTIDLMGKPIKQYIWNMTNVFDKNIITIKSPFPENQHKYLLDNFVPIFDITVKHHMSSAGASGISFYRKQDSEGTIIRIFQDTFIIYDDYVDRIKKND